MNMTLFLDKIYSRLQAEPEIAGRELIQTLGQIRLQTKEDGSWKEIVEECRRHPLMEMALEDPLTRRSFQKPRGYAGDAVMLDMIYSSRPPEGTTAIGNGIFQTTGVHGGSPRAVRFRREFLARTIDDLAAQRGGALRILTIASGHCREAMMSYALPTGGVAEWVALDQDEDSLAECARATKGLNVKCVNGSVRQVLGRRLDLGQFDFVYSAGLFDYLEQKVAAALVSRMKAMLKPGGGVLFANFAEGTIDPGYMEAFMDWNLIYRTEQDMTELAGPDASVFLDPAERVWYALVSEARDMHAIVDERDHLAAAV